MHNPHPALPPVSVVIPVLNGERTLRACLRSVLDTDYPVDRREVVLVDNGSTDRTAAVARSCPVRYLLEPHRGAASARNRGITESTGEILAFIDADCVASRTWLRELVAGFAAGPQVGGVAGEILAYPPRTAAERYMAMSHPNWQHALSGAWPFAATANVAYRRCTFERIGLFDPRLVSGEDKDFGWRFAHHGGMELRYNRRAIVFHHYHSTVRGFVRQHLRWSYGNALLHAKYHLPWGIRDELRKHRDLVAAAGTLVAAIGRFGMRRGGKREVYDRSFDVLRAMSYRAGGLRWLLTRRSLRAKFVDQETGVGS